MDPITASKIEYVALLMAEAEDDVSDAKWPGEVTRRIWVDRAKIAVEALDDFVEKSRG